MIKKMRGMTLLRNQVLSIFCANFIHRGTNCIKIGKLVYGYTCVLARSGFWSLKRWNHSSTETTLELIQEHTEVSMDHLTPEIKLHLITHNCKLWHSRGDNSPFVEPFWAFYWPGGQALSRYILDNGSVFKGGDILDIGSGCGASAIACKMVGANNVTANDIDPVAAEAIKLNSDLNGVKIKVTTSNLIGSPLTKTFDIILLGDMFYDEQFATILSDWLRHTNTHKTTILIGDPGRHSFRNHPMRKKLTKLAEFDLPITCQSENNGLTTGSVWKLQL